VTAPLGDGVILEGVTRASVLEYVRHECPDVEVVERKYTMAEVLEAHGEGRLIEAFGAGTAFFIAPVQDVHFRGVDLVLPLGQHDGANGDSVRGMEFAMQVKTHLKDVMYGRKQSAWGVVVDEEKTF
jgi:branched-chain amino acid aminotransferase